MIGDVSHAERFGYLKTSASEPVFNKVSLCGCIFVNLSVLFAPSDI